MPISRKLNEITLTFNALGNPSVRMTAIVTDDVEESRGGWNKQWNAPAVVNAAIALRDAVLAQSAGQNRPLTF